MTSCSEGSPVGWGGGGGGGATLNRKAPLGKKVTLSGRVALGRGLVF